MIRQRDDDISYFLPESNVRGGFYAVEYRAEDLGDEGAGVGLDEYLCDDGWMDGWMDFARGVIRSGRGVKRTCLEEWRSWEERG